MRVEPLARLSDLAYERLRDSIIELEIEPGSPIDEEQVRERYSLGLTPIRDALKRLSHERLVTIYPRRGTFATEINIADDQWISEIRAELEGLAAELAAERATPQEKMRLVELASQMRKTTTTDEFVSVDAQFHRTLYQAAHNPLLETNLTQYFNLSLRIWHFSIRNFSRENFLQDDFDILATAITNGDAGLARKTARHHIEYSRLVVRNMGMRIDPPRPTGT